MQPTSDGEQTVTPRAERQSGQQERESRSERPSRRAEREPHSNRNEPRQQNRTEGTAVAPRQPRRPERLIPDRDLDDQSLPDDGPTDRGTTEQSERSSQERLVIGITLGDYNGIGPEVILKALQYNQLQKICTPIIYGSMRVLNRYRNLLDFKDWNLNGIQHVGQASHKLTNVITCFSENSRPAPTQASPVAAPALLPVPSPVIEPVAEAEAGSASATDVPTPTEPVAISLATTIASAAPVAVKPAEPATAGPVVVHDIQPGKVTPEAGRAALACLQRAVEDLKAGKLDAIVTAPINKHNIQSDEFQFPGHTEYLAQAFEVGDNLMFLVSERLRVGVVTGHVPLGRVRGQIHREAILRKLKLMSQSLRGDFGIQKPRIAVLGLNPHAGEEGLLGNEEQDIIKPLIADLQVKGQLVFGPFAADGFFGTGSYRQFDAVLAMYHDQGLIPFKTLAFDEGVNFTAGMPVVRTSPDHGTAYDIAGKNLADETSMIQAIYVACDVARRRKENKELDDNALKPKAAK